MSGWLERVAGLLQEATPGPWNVSRGGSFYACELRAPDPYNGFALVKVATNEHADFDFIAASRELVPLLAKVAEAAETYAKWVALDGSYPGHEEYVEAEALEIAGERDAAEEALAVALDELREWGDPDTLRGQHGTDPTFIQEHLTGAGDE